MVASLVEGASERVQALVKTGDALWNLEGVGDALDMEEVGPRLCAARVRKPLVAHFRQFSVNPPLLRGYFKRYVTRKNYLAVYAGNQDDMDGFGAFIIKLRAPV